MGVRSAAKSSKDPDPIQSARACAIEGARTHNLKSISCRIPFGKLTAITGVSGSGKSTLAFDVLYAEGQRRFVDCLSTYARQFLQRLDRPDADFIGEIQPPVALFQHTSIRNARSTVGSITELTDLLQLLFAYAGTPHCPRDGTPLEVQDLASGAAALGGLDERQRFALTARISVPKAARTTLPVSFREQGYSRIVDAAGRIVEWEAPSPESVALVVDRFLPRALPKTRAVESLATAWKLGHGAAEIHRIASDTTQSTRISEPGATHDPLLRPAERGALHDSLLRPAERGALHDSLLRPKEPDDPELRLEKPGAARGSVLDREERRCHGGSLVRVLRQGSSCPTCGLRGEALRPQHFSPDSPLGACEECNGFGRLVTIDRDKVIPDPRCTIKGGAIKPFETKTGLRFRRKLFEQAAVRGIALDVPFRDLSKEDQNWVFEGDKRYRGVQGLFEKLERKRYRAYVRIFLARYRGYVPCPSCAGSRLRREALAVRIGGHHLADVLSLAVHELQPWVRNLALSEDARLRVRSILKEIEERLGYLDQVGLSYLTLARTARTLSGGETQRIRLATGLGSSLMQTLYVLDEPTVGLHAADTERMLEVLRQLCREDNTVVVVEHDPGIIRGADHLIVLGPSGGEEGGDVLYEGPVEPFFARNPWFFRAIPRHDADGSAELAECEQPIEGHRTETSFSTPVAIDRESMREVIRAPRPALVLHGVTQNNLRIDQVEIPTDRLVVISGVSGSGKSTLIEDVLYRNALRAAGKAVEEVGDVRRIEGLEQFADVLLVSQNPLGRSARSNLLTYTGLLALVRKLLAATPRAKQLGLPAGAFSFNVEGGRCETCKGMGSVTLEMHFLADVEIACEACRGRRFRESVLEVTLQGRSIAQILDLTVREARGFLVNYADAARRLDPLLEIGLGYLTLGQSTSTLSGGEAQRLKIASLLAEGADAPAAESARKSPRSKAGRVETPRRLFLFDEPTSGLHPQDIGRLLSALQKLVARGHSVVVVEHQLDFIRAADHVIDLGPGAGDSGGRVVFAGPPRELAQAIASATGVALREGTPGKSDGRPIRGKT